MMMMMNEKKVDTPFLVVDVFGNKNDFDTIWWVIDLKAFVCGEKQDAIKC